MPKVITSPVDLWPGTATLSDQLTYSQYLAWDDAISACVAVNPEIKFGEIAARPDLFVNFETAIFAIVSEWNIPALKDMLKGRALPATPRIPAATLAIWLINEIYQVVEGNTTVPNG